tara:strand:- start:6979 stop:7815 length:837 start_codon:yes stop_codon:yes gene_type:complete
VGILTDNTMRGFSMKKIILAFLYISLSLSFIGCTQQSSDDGGGSGQDQQGGGGGGQDFGGDGGGGDTGGTGGQCAGTTADGTGSGTAIHHFYPLVAGGESWVPGNYDFQNDPETSTFISLSDASIIFSSDSKLQFRLKVRPQPNPPAGEEYCYGRATGQSADAHTYTKLQFTVYLRDIKCDQPNAGNPSQCDSGFYLGPRYRPQMIGPVNVDSCSNIVDIGSLRNSTQYGTTIEIANVQSDSTCQFNDTFCPAGDNVRAASCWHVTLQVVTDFTQSFN